MLRTLWGDVGITFAWCCCKRALREETQTWNSLAGFVGYESDGRRAERTALQSGHSFQRIHGGAWVIVRSRRRVHRLQRRKPLQLHEVQVSFVKYKYEVLLNSHCSLSTDMWKKFIEYLSVKLLVAFMTASGQYVHTIRKCNNNFC